MRYLIALGSSVGDRQRILDTGINLISKLGRVEAISKVLETEPAGGVAKNRFFNAAMILSTTLDPHTLMENLLKIETSMGRIRGTKWDDRMIDLDIILDDGESILDTPGLKLPHPLAHERWFVLKPSSEIAPSWIHPIFNQSIQSLLEKLETP